MGTQGLIASGLAVLSVIVWWLWFVWARWKMRPEELPPAGPATMDLREEPVAVVDLLVHGCELSPAAVPATFLDLGARRFYEVHDAGGGRYVCLIDDDRPTGGLEECERLVLDAVHKAAVDKAAPMDAVAREIGPDSAMFWGRFHQAVLTAARRRGLVARAGRPVPVSG